MQTMLSGRPIARLRLRRLAVPVAVAVALLASVLLSVTPASAAFPGRNGSIAFVHADQIYSIQPDGSSLVQLTTDGQNYLPKWSPDGTRIAFVHVGATGARNIWVMAADGADKQRITTTGEVTAGPSWSPDGLWIAFAGNGLLDKVAATAPYGTPIQLGGYYTGCDGCANVNLTDFIDVDRFLAWSPDGTRIALYNHDDAQVDDMIYMYYIDTREIRHYNGTGGECCGHAYWSDFNWTVSGTFGYVTIGVTGHRPGKYSKIKLAGFQTHRGDKSFAPSPSDSKMALTNDIDGTASLFIAKADGRSRRLLTDGYQPDWQPIP